MDINWDDIKSVNGWGYYIPTQIERLFSDSKEISSSAGMWIEFEIVNAGLLYEAAYYTIDLLMQALEKETIHSKYYALSLLLELSCGESIEEIVITCNNGKNENLNLTIACRRKIKSYLSKIKNIQDNYDYNSLGIINGIIKIVEMWDDTYSNDLYFSK